MPQSPERSTLRRLIEDYQKPGGFGNTLKAGAAGLLGFPSDILQTMASVAQPPAVRAVHGSPQVPGNSEQIAGLLGANLERPSGMVGLIGAPDPGDIGRLAGVGLLGTARKLSRNDIADMTFYRGITGDDVGREVGEYFTDSEAIARSYIPQNVAGESGQISGQMISAKFKPENPMIVDMKGAIKDDKLDRRYFAQANRNGNDAIVLVNVRDKASAGQRSGSLAHDYARGGPESTIIVPLKESALPETLGVEDIVRDIKMRPKTRSAAEEAALDAEVDEIVKKMLEDELR